MISSRSLVICADLVMHHGCTTALTALWNHHLFQLSAAMADFLFRLKWFLAPRVQNWTQISAHLNVEHSSGRSFETGRNWLSLPPASLVSSFCQSNLDLDVESSSCRRQFLVASHALLSLKSVIQSTKQISAALPQYGWTRYFENLKQFAIWRDPFRKGQISLRVSLTFDSLFDPSAA